MGKYASKFRSAAICAAIATLTATVPQASAQTPQLNSDHDVTVVPF